MPLICKTGDAPSVRWREEQIQAPVPFRGGMGNEITQLLRLSPSFFFLRDKRTEGNADN